MVISTKEIQKICYSASKDVAQAYDGLQLHFVVYQKGKLRDAIAIADHDFSYHPAAETARSILRKQVKHDISSFVGLAIASKSKFLGFKKIEKILGLFVINANDFNTIEEAQNQIAHTVWHAIDLYEIRQRPEYKNKFTKGAMIPKRSPMNLSKSHLQADAFAVFLGAINGSSDLARILAQRRALQSLEPITSFKSESYPFVIAMEACELAVEDLKQIKIEPYDQYKIARKFSLDIGHAFDETSIQQWWKYSLPAQDMAWRGSSPEEILGAALNTSDNPFVRSIAYLVDEIVDITALKPEMLAGIYNSFLNTEKVFEMHTEMVEAAFEEAIAEGLRESSPEAFMKAANIQNEKLTEGKILGWCASALQNAGTAFDNALKSGTAPDQAARVNFKITEADPNWKELTKLGKKIVDERRDGFAVTMGHIAEICHNNDAFKGVLDSIKITMNDPSYLQKLEAANDLTFVPSGPAISGPAPKGPAPKGPAPKGLDMSGPTSTPAPMPAPGMGGPGGGGNRQAQIMHQKRLLAEKQKAKQTQKNTRSSKDKTDKE